LAKQTRIGSDAGETARPGTVVRDDADNAFGKRLCAGADAALLTADHQPTQRRNRTLRSAHGFEPGKQVIWPKALGRPIFVRNFASTSMGLGWHGCSKGAPKPGYGFSGAGG